MSANRARDTGPERELRRALHLAGAPQFGVNDDSLPGRPDITFPASRLAVFVHGCFWHHCPYCQRDVPKSHPEFWRAKFRANATRDRRKKEALNRLGWRVITIRECRLRSNPEGTVARVMKKLGHV